MPEGDRNATGDRARDVELLDRTTAYQGRFRVDVYTVRHTLHAGGWSPPIRREVFERGNAAAVLPYDPERDEVVLIEQFRAGALAAGEPPWLVEIVAGIVDPGETEQEVVRREAIEEAGLEIGALEPVARCLMTPGACSEIVSIYCGRVAAAGAGGIHGLDHEHEDIRVLVLPFAEAERALAERRFDNAITVISLQWLALNRARLREIWR